MLYVVLPVTSQRIIASLALTVTDAAIKITAPARRVRFVKLFIGLSLAASPAFSYSFFLTVEYDSSNQYL
ncbi:hypothetical protein BZM27_37440 [Paraburkholderia steynii]|uniref:Uncharacterized protein n=1 Tax=Paraburkholderia steynii TaxID=1245441 RepID=A0A4R0X7Q6_9BURK|nr:hypothetical protein BZM27_37440 [Paraburkholderia steynii]